METYYRVLNTGVLESVTSKVASSVRVSSMGWWSHRGGIDVKVYPSVGVLQAEGESKECYANW